MTVAKYLENLNKRFKTGISTEHTYRADLQNLLESLAPDLMVTNEATRIQCGAPDYILTKDAIPVGYIEAKDVGVDFKSKNLKEQFDRYRASLDNLIITDYLDFHLYVEGEFITSVKIGEIQGKLIQPLQDNFPKFESLIQDFCSYKGQTITASKKLAEMMAGKAKMLSVVLENALLEDEVDEKNTDTSLQSQLNAFKEILIHDIKPKEFADIYAQTIAYGMFAARFHDKNLDTFSRQKASELIPKTNPFLRKLFQFIAGYDLDSRIVWIVDSLAGLFHATDVSAILKNFGKATQTHDPIIHFYETFLAEYDPKLRKTRGVWYTPEPVVDFIVRSVDEILRSEFALKNGLADNSKVKVKVKIPTHDKRYSQGVREVDQEFHKIQLLDPATGTGTFLAQVIKHVHKEFQSQKGLWNSYVENHLIPRVNGFEILMASYAMAHLKLDMLLTELNYKPSKEQRFKIYLTNSLEEHHPDTGTLFAGWLSAEANEANQIKRDTPVMVIIGNPPYMGESTNKGDWIMDLMEDYKKEPGGIEKLKEKNPKWINDDYVKFLRYGQYFIEKNGEGVLAFINPHGFLDNPTFRGMRWNLLKTYDKIYTLDLHGNSKKKEKAPDGSIDSNVFDIMQGVSINIFIKNGKKKSNELGTVFHYDLFGKREAKYDFLVSNSVSSVDYKELPNVAPNYYFVHKDLNEQATYNRGFSAKELFIKSVLGFQTHRDHYAIDFDRETTVDKMQELRSKLISNEKITKSYDLKDNRDWKLNEQRDNIQRDKDWQQKIVTCLYRPFDYRSCHLSYVTMDYPRKEILVNILNKENVSLLLSRQQAVTGFQHCFVTNLAPESCVISNKTKEQNVVFPLYLYPEKTGQQTIDNVGRVPNLNAKIINMIAEDLGIPFNLDSQDRSSFSPVNLIDYIYAVLYQPTYRERYKEFLKIDFPRVPYPSDPNDFWQLVTLGSKLRKIHLLESETLNNLITTYPIEGNNEVGKLKYKDEKVYINDTQYFGGIELSVWEFFIGSYQPAQKWLKDRKDRTLSFEDIMHYQKIVSALSQTIQIMDEIDQIEID